MENPGLHKRAGHALALLTLVSVGVATGACDTDTGAIAQITTPSPFRSELVLSPSFVRLTPSGGLDCPGFVFSTSLNLIVTAGAEDLTMDSLTLHLLDGTNVGGPSVTIPNPQLNAQFGSTFVRAGTNRVFALQPAFDCVERQPRSLAVTAFLSDRRGARETRTVTSVVR